MVFASCVDGVPAECPSVHVAGVHSGNLPAQLTSFVGREREIREAAELLNTSRARHAHRTAAIDSVPSAWR